MTPRAPARTPAERPETVWRGGRRHYRTPGGAVYPSVTTLLSSTVPEAARAGLERWRALDPASEYISSEARLTGTAAHRMIEQRLSGREPDSDGRLLSRAHYENLLPFLAKISDPLGVELGLYSDRMRLAGTPDCVAWYDGRMSVIDYKTKRSEQREEWLRDYFLQGAAYSRMFEERTGVAVPRVVILVSTEQDTRGEFVREASDFYGELDARLCQYYASGHPHCAGPNC